VQLNRLYKSTRVLKRFVFNRDPFWIRPWWLSVRPSIIAQAYVEGRPANCAVVCWEGKVLAGIGVEVISSAGQTGPATVVRAVNNCEMMEAAARIAKRLSLSGFFGLDFMIANGTDDAYLIEMNPRCTTLCHLQLGKGRNMVGALWAQLSGQPTPETPPVTENGLIAYFPQAWNSKEQLLESSFQDIPKDEPELVAQLLRPWPNRTLLYRLGNALTAPRTQKP
jgi:predicted ATP-grasp superfamily ATP-dependent carboligase